MGSLLGIDISHHQAKTPKLAGRAFVFVRASYGDAADGRFPKHAAAVRASGCVLGAYHFGRNVRPVPAQVKAFLKTAGDAELLALDVEVDHHKGVPDDPAMTRAQAMAFVKAVHAAGRQIGLYHSESGFFDAGQDWDWVANWGKRPKRRWHVWQYRGSPLDLNRFDGSRSELLGLGGLPPAPETDVASVEGPMNLVKSIYQRGIRVEGGRGIFTIAAHDKAFLIRNTVANEILPLVGNTGTGWQVVDPGDPGGVAGFVANDVVTAFVDIPAGLMAAAEVAVASGRRRAKPGG
jgi:hypothetical protein